MYSDTELLQDQNKLNEEGECAIGEAEHTLICDGHDLDLAGLFYERKRGIRTAS